MVINKIQLQKIADEIFGNSLYVKIIFIVFMLLLGIAQINTMISPYIKFVLLYGLIVVVYDIFTHKNIFHNKYFFLILVFCSFLGLSLLVNYDKGFISNIKDYLYTLLSFFVIAMVPLNKNKKKVESEFKIILLISTLLLFCISIIALYTFAFQIQVYCVSETGTPYYLGVSPDSRLYGVSGNPNILGLQMALLIILSFSGMLLFKTKKRWLFLILILFGFFSLLLSSSRSSWIAVLIAGIFLVYFSLLHYSKKKLNAKIVFQSILLTFIFTFVSLGCASFVQNVLGYIPAIVMELDNSAFHDSSDSGKNNQVSESENGESLVSEDSDTIDKINTKRVYTDESKTGSDRLALWKTAIEIFKHHPIFGVGYSSTNEYGEIYLPDMWKDGMNYRNVHNLYLQILASSGFFSFISFIAMIIYFLYKGICVLLKFLSKKVPETVIFISILSCIMMFLIQQMFEMQMIYELSILSGFFSICLGYFQYYLQKSDDNYNKM